MSIDKFGRSSKRRRDDSFFKLTIFGDLDCKGRKITNVDEPEHETDVATKSYVKELGHDMQNKLTKFQGKINEQIESPKNQIIIQTRSFINDEIQKLINKHDTDLEEMKEKIENKLLIISNNIESLFDKQESKIKENVMNDINKQLASFRSDLVIAAKQQAVDEFFSRRTDMLSEFLDEVGKKFVKKQ